MSDLDVVQSDLVRRMFVQYLDRTRCDCTGVTEPNRQCFRCQTINDMRTNLPEIANAALEIYALSTPGYYA